MCQLALLLYLGVWICLSSVLFLPGCECLSCCPFSPACPQLCSCLGAVHRGRQGHPGQGSLLLLTPPGMCGAVSPHCLPSGSSPKGKNISGVGGAALCPLQKNFKTQLLNSTQLLADTHWVLLFIWTLMPFNLLRSYENMLWKVSPDSSPSKFFWLVLR